MRENDKLIVPALGVAVIIAVFVLGAGSYSIGHVAILFVLGLAAVGTYFAPEQVQVEARTAIAALGLIVLIFMFSSLGFWLALLSFGAIGALQIRHRGILRMPPTHTLEWLRTLQEQRGGGGAEAAAVSTDGGDEAPAPAQPAAATWATGIMGKAGIGGVGASALGVIILCTAVMPWFSVSIDAEVAEREGLSESQVEEVEGDWSSWKLVRLLRENDEDSSIPYGIAGATMALALLALASVVLPRWAPAVVGVAGLGVMIFTFIYVVGVLDLGDMPEGVNTSFGTGSWLASLAFILVAGLQLIPRPKRSSV